MECSNCFFAVWTVIGVLFLLGASWKVEVVNDDE